MKRRKVQKIVVFLMLFTMLATTLLAGLTMFL